MSVADDHESEFYAALGAGDPEAVRLFNKIPVRDTVAGAREDAMIFGSGACRFDEDKWVVTQRIHDEIMLAPRCQAAKSFTPAPIHQHRCRKPDGHKSRHRCGCFGGKCTVSWRTK